MSLNQAISVTDAAMEVRTARDQLHTDIIRGVQLRAPRSAIDWYTETAKAQ